MPVAYNIFMKHAEFISKSVSKTRPILSGVLHHADGSLYVTDSHRLYAAKNSHSRTDGAVIHPKTGEFIDGSYPDVTRLIPNNDPSGVIHIENVKQTLEAVKVLFTAGGIGLGKVPKNKISIRLSSDDDRKVTLKINKNELFNAEYFLTFADEVDPGFTIDFSAEYFAQALALFKDAGYISVDMNLYGSLRPFILTVYDKSLQALILPIRNGEN